MSSLLWFRNDLRLSDNAALAAAASRGKPIVPVFILDDEEGGAWGLGGASRWWLHGSLERLSESLRQRGSHLVLRRGPVGAVLETLVNETKADAIYWNRRYEPFATQRDARIKVELSRRGIFAESYNATLLHEPLTLGTKLGTPYRVFTPFRRALFSQRPAGRHVAAPNAIPAPRIFPASDELGTWNLRPRKPDWAAGLRALWRPGEAGAQERLTAFLDDSLPEYHAARDSPAASGTSRLSPHLHFGEISPQAVFSAVRSRAFALSGNDNPIWAEKFLSEIAWREFSYHLLFHFPHLPETPLRPEFADFPWEEKGETFRAWRAGMTGYPIVDAGMRELWATGWMHNRVRMIVASFLVKDLLQPWQRGEEWFWDTLVDADLANNAASWQWVAGCGADAAPFFRIFNPVLQGEKFDPDGEYVRRWIPPLAKLPNNLIHKPWAARPVELSDANIRLDRDYPRPILDHDFARKRALAAMRAVSKSGPAEPPGR